MASTSADSPQLLDVVVIGAGQAGLAIGYHLKQREARFLIVDAAPEVGHAWRARWDSLRLFTPAEYDGLPGVPFPAPAGTHPSKDDVAAYLRAYAEGFQLPVQLNTPVTEVRRTSGGFAVMTTAGVLHARQVVVATGPFQRPIVPVMASQLAADVAQLHSADYRNREQLPEGGRVLVVGAANSGLQIADELRTSHPVTVAVGSQPPQLPQRLLGRDLFRWLVGVGLMTKPATSGLARRLRARGGDLVIGSSSKQMRRRGVQFRPRLTGFAGRTATFVDGTTVDVDAVVWATGYRSDYSWLHVPGVVEDGTVRHHAGVTDVPGLYFIGLPWQTCRGSALLGFVGRDAEVLARQMAARTPLPPSPAAITTGFGGSGVVRAAR
jgi:putative flavoprotein involved in K+ transport